MNSDKLNFFKQTTSFNKKVFTHFFSQNIWDQRGPTSIFFPLANETNQTAPNFHPQMLFTHFSRQFFSAIFENYSEPTRLSTKILTQIDSNFDSNLSQQKIEGHREARNKNGSYDLNGHMIMW